MPSGLQALLALLLLLPGFVSARIVRLLNARSTQSDLERIIQALIYSFIIYVIYCGLFGASLPIEWTQVNTPPSAPHFVPIIHRWRICTLGLLSVMLGGVRGIIKGRDWHMRVLRSCGVTERTSRESVWNDVMLTQQGTVQVGLADGRIALGVLQRYSDTGEEGSLFIGGASWVNEDASLEPIPGPGLLITKSADIHFIMFLGDGGSLNPSVQIADIGL